MGRLILFLVIGFLAWLVYRAISNAARGRQVDAAPSLTEDMVKCMNCGVNLPKSEARLVDGAYRCPDGVPCLHRDSQS